MIGEKGKQSVSKREAIGEEAICCCKMYTYRQPEGQEDTQTDTQTDRHTDTQTNRNTYIIIHT